MKRLGRCLGALFLPGADDGVGADDRGDHYHVAECSHRDRERRAGAKDRHERRPDLGEQEVGESFGLGEVWPRAPALTCLAAGQSIEGPVQAAQHVINALPPPALRQRVTQTLGDRPGPASAPKPGGAIGHCEQSADVSRPVSHPKRRSAPETPHRPAHIR